MKIDVKNCARCGAVHRDLEFYELANPKDKYTWWALCPLMNQPVLMEVQEDVVDRASRMLAGEWGAPAEEIWELIKELRDEVVLRRKGE